MEEKSYIIEKKLSSNDLGKTGGHQGGMLIPKKKELLEFFPTLNADEENPRVVIDFTDDVDTVWKFNFIYYNNKFRGGTRNEYRLTGMTKFFKGTALEIGDILILERKDNEFYIHTRRENLKIETDEEGVVTLIIDNDWKMITC